MKKKLISLFLLGTSLYVVSVIALMCLSSPVHADDECVCSTGQDESTCNAAKLSCLEGKVNQKKQAANTLSNTISIINGQIVVQELQIKQTQLEINKLNDDIQQLSVRIAGLNLSLNQETEVLIQRVQANYKSSRTNALDSVLFSSSLNDFFRRLKYLQVAQQHTTEILKAAESQRITFDQEKTLKQQKQAEVDQKKQKLLVQENELNKQKTDQQVLLQQTRNDESRYQAELEKTLAEQQALQSIIAGNGAEQRVGDVNQGDVIASIIPGPSPCSNGAHLHFEVAQNGAVFNPAGYLKPIDGIIWNNEPDDPFGFSGNWNWPINDAARINQGFGMTFYARVRRAYGGAPHTGIDMISKTPGDHTVKAVKSGTLFRGSIRCGAGQLRYVRVEHKDGGGLSSYYLHVNY